ncbi:hypothetical protein [Caulobacter phage Cr30]|uniref:hypothetical protein n=1 Tax=Caulobacter phage Cr30 TaxID=1357714 RepID=UPI0004A9B8EF|nr:hypothetical protein OZ74_gp095 [Caulobacter phage Cr30]AGS80980.1 hypothetical protein [Caulobacter phage Cr30]
MNNPNFMSDGELLSTARLSTHSKEEYKYLCIVLARKYEEALNKLEIAQPFVDAIDNMIEMREYYAD